MNARLNGLHIYDVTDPANTVMFYESRPGRNMHGGPELLPAEPRHFKNYCILFADGRPRVIKRKDIDKLNWDPKKKGSYPVDPSEHRGN